MESGRGGGAALKSFALRILGMSWGVKNTFFEAPGVSLGGSGVSIGGVKILRVEEGFLLVGSTVTMTYSAKSTTTTT